MTSLYIENLVIEATRKCNMQCEHCLRGPAQRKTISDQHIYKMLQLIDDVSCLTITGGEPTLAMDALEQIRHCTIYGRCDIGNFYMVTNGKSIHIEELAEWIYGMEFACTDNEVSAVTFSFDQFHTQTFNWNQSQKQENNFARLQEKMSSEYGLSNGCGGEFIYKHSDKSWG